VLPKINPDFCKQWNPPAFINRINTVFGIRHCRIRRIEKEGAIRIGRLDRRWHKIIAHAPGSLLSCCPENIVVLCPSRPLAESSMGLTLLRLFALNEQHALFD